MAEEASYTIVAKIVAKDASQAGAKSAEQGIDRVLVKSDALSLSLGRAFALLGGVMGLGALVKGFVGINSQIQDATTGLATLYTAVAHVDIGRGVRLATTDITELRKAAREGVGELSDYLGTYQRILGPGLAAGASRAALRKLTSETIAAVGAVKGPGEIGLAQEELLHALTAGVGRRTTPVTLMALDAIGITEAAFNKLRPSEKLADLTRAFQAFGPGVALMGQSWSAQFDTLKDNVKAMIGTVGKPLFDRWSADLIKVNQWLDQNRDRLAEIATTWGNRLLALWDHLIARAGVYAAILAGVKMAPLVRGGIDAGVAGADAIGRGVAAVAADARWGASLPGREGFMGKMAGGVAGAAGGILAGVGPWVARLAGAAAGLALPLTVVVLGFEALWEGVKRGGPGMKYLSAAFDSLTEAGGRLWAALGPLGDVFSDTMATIGDGLLEALGAFVNAIAWTVDQVATLTSWLPGGDEALRQYEMRKAQHQDAVELAKRRALAKHDDGTDGLNVGKNVTNINGPVSISMKAEINADPDRTIIAVGKALDKIRTAAVQGRRIPGLSGA